MLALMGIRDWPIDERPREKLLERGAAALSDAEILAILLGSGRKGRSALDVARDALQSFGSLRQLVGADRARFCACAGLGLARYAQVQAAAELSRRLTITPYVALQCHHPGWCHRVQACCGPSAALTR